MESDAGRDANKSLWVFGQVYTLCRSEKKPENKVRFFEHPLIYLIGAMVKTHLP